MGIGKNLVVVSAETRGNNSGSGYSRFTNEPLTLFNFARSSGGFWTKEPANDGGVSSRD